jgi:anthranilate synthase/aminodeoxychorismate synthase-like glutamine amidotransferase
MSARVLLIDNYDSFTWNLAQALLSLGAGVDVRRNDAIGAKEACDLAPTHLVISPGPGRPENAGATLSILDALLTRVPILGVCLGHQALAVVMGARVVPASRLRYPLPGFPMPKVNFLAVLVVGIAIFMLASSW